MFRLPRLFKNREKLPPKFGSDLRDLGPLHACPCGSMTFTIMASFYDYQLSWYHLDGECSNCGNLVIVPTPIDKPDYIQE